MLLLMLFLFSLTIGAFWLSQSQRRLALAEAKEVKLALKAGDPRSLEVELRKVLALAEAGEAVGPEREGLARAQLLGLLIAQWRLGEARELCPTDLRRFSAMLRAFIRFGSHQLDILTETPTQEKLEEIRAHGQECLQQVPVALHRSTEQAWQALEGLCLLRMGHVREAIPLLENGLTTLNYDPTRIVYLFHLGQAYEHLGEGAQAKRYYQEATQVFPGTRLASEASARLLALDGLNQGDVFHSMLAGAPDLLDPATRKNRSSS